LQLITAIAAVANKGKLVKPQILKYEKANDGKVKNEFKPVAVRQVISEQTSLIMTKILEGVVEKGTGIEAKIAGYRVAGKTGTAQKVDPRTGLYDPYNFLSSFVGYFPAEDPKIIIYVQVDEPKGEQFGGVVAGPVFRNVAKAVIDYMGIPSESKVQTTGFFGEELSGGMQVSDKAYSASVMPDLTGKTIRNVLTIMGKYPVKVEVSGSGLAVGQWPAAGSMLKEGQTVNVTFRLRKSELISFKYEETEIKEDKPHAVPAPAVVQIKKVSSAKTTGVQKKTKLVNKKQPKSKKGKR
jgi:membrane peptidoglycan carboxypeptidase